MIGDTPQPGETPRNEGNPWSLADPETSWWHNDTDRPAAEAPTGRGRHQRRTATQQQAEGPTGGTDTLLPPGVAEQPRTEAAAEAHAAATRDVAVELDPRARPEVTPVERAHDEPDAHRYSPLRPPGLPATAYPAKITADQPAAGPKAGRLTTTADQPAAGPKAGRLTTTADQPAAGPKPGKSATTVDEPIAGAKPDIFATTAAEPGPVEVVELAGSGAGWPKGDALNATRPEAHATIAHEPGGFVIITESPRDVDGPADTATPVQSPPEAAQQADPVGTAKHAERQADTEMFPLDEPDVMVLPEPNVRNRPTVPLDRGPLAGSGRDRSMAEPLPPPTGSPSTDVRLERLENSPFWHTDPAVATQPLPTDRSNHTGTRRRPRKTTRRPVPAMIALVLLALVSAFFGWVSAEPFWLAVGHGEAGYSTTTQCTGKEVTQRCVGRFTATDNSFAVSRVALLGVGPAERPPGTVAQARMVSRNSQRAYLGDTIPLLQLRWLLGLGLVLVCGYSIAGVTGARRLKTGRARRGAVLLSLTGPLLLLVGFLIAAY